MSLWRGSRLARRTAREGAQGAAAQGGGLAFLAGDEAEVVYAVLGVGPQRDQAAIDEADLCATVRVGGDGVADVDGVAARQVTAAAAVGSGLHRTRGDDDAARLPGQRGCAGQQRKDQSHRYGNPRGK